MMLAFSLKQFQKKRDQICDEKNISIMFHQEDLVSLMQKGIIRKEGEIYSIHFRLIPYMRLKQLAIMQLQFTKLD